MANDKNPGQKNKEDQMGEDNRQTDRQRPDMEEAERRARQGSPQPGGKDARPWSDRDTDKDTSRGPGGGGTRY